MISKEISPCFHDSISAYGFSKSNITFENDCKQVYVLKMLEKLSDAH